MSCLKVHNINKSFGDKKVLNNINFEIEKGNVITLIGPSGVGKTTLLNIIMGLLFQDNGEVIYEEKSLVIHYDKEVRKKIAYIPDNPIFYDYLTGLENIRYIMDIYKSNKTDEELNEYLKEFNLFESKDKLFKNYSKGMKQKLMLLSIYIINAELLILDEPTTGLDIVSRYELSQIILKFKEMGKTILLATHDINFCEDVSDEYLIIKDGSIVCVGKNDKNENLQDKIIKYLKDE